MLKSGRKCTVVLWEFDREIMTWLKWPITLPDILG